MRRTIVVLVVAAVVVLMLAFAGPVFAAGGEGQGTAGCAKTAKDATVQGCPKPGPAQERRSF